MGSWATSIWSNSSANLGEPLPKTRRAVTRNTWAQCAKIANRGTYRHDCTPYPCEASRERRRNALLLFLPCRSRSRERFLLLLIILAPSTPPTCFTRIRRAIASVDTSICNLSTLLGPAVLSQALSSVWGNQCPNFRVFATLDHKGAAFPPLVQRFH